MRAKNLEMTIDRSRHDLLQCVGPNPELTLVRGFGNIGDELIWSGQRQLLSEHIYREITIPDLRHSTGDTVLLSGGGAWSPSYHEHMPTVLAIAEANFRRVIVLPSTFDVRVDRVRQALTGSRAIFFARERESYRRISGLCDARLAHDSAFFFDYQPYKEIGRLKSNRGTLSAYRTDRESSGLTALPEHNNDISATAPDLATWLELISEHETIVTDRAHVMIAAALMDKEVQVSEGGYFKIGALADTLPPNSRVSQCVVDLRTGTSAAPRNSSIEKPVASPTEPRALAIAEGLPNRALRVAAPIATVDEQPRVCAVILSHNRHDMVARSARSVQVSGPGVRTLILDNNSDDRTRTSLARLAAQESGIAVQLSDRNLGCAGGRSIAVEKVTEEFVLFLDDDAVLLPGSLELLVEQLDMNPLTQAITASVVSPDGSIQHCGGSYVIDADYASFTGDGSGQHLFEATAPRTGRCDWVPGTAALIRRSAFDVCPIDPAMTSYYEDNDWAIRMQNAFDEPFRRCREAVAVHDYGPRATTDSPPALADHYGHRLQTLARFYDVHDRILVSGGVEISDVLAGTGALAHNPAAARLLLRVVAEAGPQRFAVDWAAGDFARVLEGIRNEVADRGRVEADLDRLLVENAKLRSQRNRARAKRDSAIAVRRKSRAALKRTNAALERMETTRWWRIRKKLDPVVATAKKTRQTIKRGVAKR